MGMRSSRRTPDDAVRSCRCRAIGVYTGEVQRDFRLAGALVQPGLNRIVRGAESVRLEPKVMQVLLQLAAKPAEVVTRDELVAAVWPDVFVTDDVLNRAVRELRKVFGDSPEQPRVIETIRKRGYRLVAPVEHLDVRSESAAVPGAPEFVADEPFKSQGAPSPQAGVNDRGRWIAISSLLAATLATVVGTLAWRASRPEASPLSIRFAPLTTAVGNEVDPALAPDGDRLAFAVTDEHGFGTLMIQPLGQAAARLAAGRGDERAPAWSPDGGRIAFTRRSTSQLRDVCEIVMLDVATRFERPLAECGNSEEFRMSWTPDNRWLLVSHASGHGAGWQIARISVASGERQMLTLPPPRILGDHTASVSPDGSRIAFVRSISGTVGDVFLVSTGGGQPSRLSYDSADIVGLTWSRDGRSLVVASDRAGGYSLWRYPIDGGAPALVAGGGTKMKHPSRAANGDAIAYESWNYEINVWEAGLGHGTQSPRLLLAASDQWTFHPSISSDGRTIAFVSTRAGGYEVWLANRDGQHPRQLTHFGRCFSGLPRWSPDGRSLLVTARPDGRASAYLVPLDGSEPRRITPAGVDVVAPAWSHDGRAVYFGSRQSGEWQVWKVPADGSGRAAQVARAGAYSAMESLDGRWLYFTRVDRPGVWRLRVDDATSEEQVIATLAPEDWANWFVGRAGIYWLERHDEVVPRLMLVSTEGGPPNSVASLPNLAWSGLGIAPDERTVLYARSDRRDSNIMSVEFGSERSTSHANADAK
jgi:Tol biopolymer transport system component/DNA-binding winged helix-turn-helix (wHTH) protein